MRSIEQQSLAKQRLFDIFGPTDPKVEKERILADKDDLLHGSCSWVFEHDTFKSWWSDDERSSVLWIHGDPGKGKTMIMTAAIDEISQRLRQEPDTGALAYFFCQQQDSRLNHAVAVIKGLIYSLVCQHNAFVNCLQETDLARNNQEHNIEHSFWKLYTALVNVLENVNLPKVYLLVDALDECTTNIFDLRRLFARFKLPSKVRWLVTSRNEPHIQEILEQNGWHINLEHHPSQVSEAVNKFINIKVKEISERKRYNSELRAEVHEHLLRNAQGTYLWVALVCKELGKVRAKHAKIKLRSFPSGLEPLYDRMLAQVDSQDDKGDAELCRRILRFVTVAMAPQNIRVLPVMCAFPNDMLDDPQNIEDLILRCGSFLALRDGIVHFVHQSSADFFINGPGRRIFPQDQEGEHYRIADLCLRFMNETLKEDICNLNHPGILCTEIEHRKIDTCIPASVQYACCYWVKHIDKAGYLERSTNNPVGYLGTQELLEKHLLHWFEALSLLRQVSGGIIGLQYLESAIKVSIYAIEKAL